MIIDLEDASIVDNESYNYAIGISIANVNGDNIVDIEDMSIIDNNAFNYVSIFRP